MTRCQAPLPLKSALPGLAWPALPGHGGVRALALQYQLDKTQWWGAARLEQEQMQQLALLLAHAYNTVPFWRDRLAPAGFRPGDVPTPAWLAALPVLTREEMQQRGAALFCPQLPPDHGTTHDSHTSGSTGRPVAFRSTGITRMFWLALTLREHLWQRRDFGGAFAGIRPHVSAGDGVGWGEPTDTALVTGPWHMLNIFTPVGAQQQWLLERNPDYLLSLPTNLHALAQAFIESGCKLPRLRQVVSIGEVLTADTREICRQAWGVEVADIYSSEEAGYIALQCPQRAQYHVQSESVYVEVLDSAGRRCGPGETGRVVVTALHNFAMPLIRYELGDFARVGGACTCGRGLPVIDRIAGRTRNMLRLPNGARRWPVFGLAKLLAVAPVRQFQVIQKTLEDIEVSLVVPERLDAATERHMSGILSENLGGEFRIRFRYVDHIESGPTGKFEEFLCEVR